MLPLPTHGAVQVKLNTEITLKNFSKVEQSNEWNRFLPLKYPSCIICDFPSDMHTYRSTHTYHHLAIPIFIYTFLSIPWNLVFLREMSLFRSRHLLCSPTFSTLCLSLGAFTSSSTVSHRWKLYLILPASYGAPSLRFWFAQKTSQLVRFGWRDMKTYIV